MTATETGIGVRLPAAESRQFDVVGFGQNSFDIVARVDEYPAPGGHHPIASLDEFVGGEIATAVVACARLGCRAGYAGRVGDDDRGARVVTALQREGVDVAGVDRVEGAQTRTAIILVDRMGRRTVLWHRDPRLNVSADRVRRLPVADGRVLLVDAMDPAAALVAARLARAAGAATVLDVDRAAPGVDELLTCIDVVIASEEFPSAYTGLHEPAEALRAIQRQSGAALVVTTLGERGSLAVSAGGHEIHTPAAPVAVVDTTGAGDAFRGGFVAAWMKLGDQMPAATLLAYASVTAALNCRNLGAQTSLPRWHEVVDLVTGPRYGWSN